MGCRVVRCSFLVLRGWGEWGGGGGWKVEALCIAQFWDAREVIGSFAIWGEQGCFDSTVAPVVPQPCTRLNPSGSL